MPLYLDYAASAIIDSRVAKIVSDEMLNPGNASSRTHSHGNERRVVVEDARKKLACLLEVEPSEVIFTSGATESDNIAILGLEEYAISSGKMHIVSTSIEHKAVLETLHHLESKGFDVTLVNPGVDGVVTSQDILSKVRSDTLLVSMMHVNNETGAIQPVREVGQALIATDTLFHIDAAQSAGKLVKEIQASEYDLLSVSGHKMYGPQGVGALIVKRRQFERVKTRPIQFGGGQERSIRSGTLPVALIAGLGEASRIAQEEYMNDHDHCIQLRQTLRKQLDSSEIAYVWNSEKTAVSHIANIEFIGVSSEALMIAIRDIASISNGSACSSGSYKPSYVLKAMDLDDEAASCCVRISWGRDTELNDFEKAIDGVLAAAASLQ